MDTQQFLAEFGHIADAPGGVARLRELVLHLAVFGDLVKTESPIDAAPLLESIAKRKREYKDKKRVISGQPPLSRAAIQAPSHWAVCRLGDIALTITGGGTPSKSHLAYWNGDIPWASVKDLKGFNYLDGTEEHITEEGLRNSSSNLIPSGRIIVCTRMGLGKIAINRVALAINQDLKALELPAEVNPDFFLILYKTRKVKGTGTTVSGIKQDQLLALPVALPPIAEQSRIVAKVNELMVLCDQLEAQQQDRRNLRNALRQSTLQALASAQSPHELQNSWQRLQANFGYLFSEPGDVRLFRDVLFDLALRGMLLPQAKLGIQDDSSGKELGALPVGWEWKTIADLSEYITSGSRGWKAHMSSAGDSFIRSQDIRQDALIFDSPAFVSLPERVEGKRTLVRPGDVLLTITGGNVGRCAVVPELPNKAYVSQHVALIRLHEPSLSEFIHFWMVNAFGGRAFLARYIYGDKPGLNLAQVGSVPIPVPPAPVASEILASLRRHQALCDDLVQQLEVKCDVAVRLSIAAVAALTGVTLERDQDISVKAPQTELVAPLCLGTPPDAKAQAPLATILARHNGKMSARDLWQRFGGEIDAFYAQLKTEVAYGWIAEPQVAEVREKSTEIAGA